ncbi:NAD(P)-dependent alcohol dehydrogenase [Maricurvus nonylphenolicus]|uniref:zinc-dependent alcohol dehydrogenase family protein n=1 Tax=Maricurvus nonylphenolicus TaxID=1008307 RepID=UPI0036F39599
MKTIEIKKPGGIENLSLTDIEQPQVVPGKVLVRWRATSLNFHDYLVASGLLPVANGRVPMSDGAGEVVAVGEGVTQWRPGDKVMSVFFPNWLDGRPSLEKMSAILGETVDGCASEYTCLPANALTAMPDHLEFTEAATLPCAALTAWRALVEEGGLKAGDTVLIEGTGGMSIAALQIAKASGAFVFATSSSDHKLEQLKALGADELINYREDPKWGKTVNRLSSGGVDHVLDVGGEATLSQSVAAARIDGNVSLIGVLGGFKARISLPTIFQKNLHITGIAVGSQKMQSDMVSAYNASGIKPVIDQSFGLSELGEAFQYQELGEHFGKIVVEI